jgi:hypothetical protein
LQRAFDRVDKSNSIRPMDTNTENKIARIVQYGISEGYQVEVICTPGGGPYVEGKKKVNGGVETINLGFVASANGVI